MDDGGSLRPIQHDQLQEVPRLVRAEDQVERGVLADLVDSQRASNGVLDVLIGDSVAERRTEDIHMTNVLRN